KFFADAIRNHIQEHFRHLFNGKGERNTNGTKQKHKRHKQSSQRKGLCFLCLLSSVPGHTIRSSSAALVLLRCGSSGRSRTCRRTRRLPSEVAQRAFRHLLRHSGTRPTLPVHRHRPWAASLSPGHGPQTHAVSSPVSY